MIAVFYYSKRVNNHINMYNNDHDHHSHLIISETGLSVTKLKKDFSHGGNYFD